MVHCYKLSAFRCTVNPYQQMRNLQISESRHCWHTAVTDKAWQGSLCVLSSEISVIKRKKKTSKLLFFINTVIKMRFLIFNPSCLVLNYLKAVFLSCLFPSAETDAWLTQSSLESLTSLVSLVFSQGTVLSLSALLLCFCCGLQCFLLSLCYSVMCKCEGCECLSTLLFFFVCFFLLQALMTTWRRVSWGKS